MIRGLQCVAVLLMFSDSPWLKDKHTFWVRSTCWMMLDVANKNRLLRQEQPCMMCIYISTFSCFSALLPFPAVLHFGSSTFHTSQLFYLAGFLLVSCFAVLGYPLCGIDVCNTLTRFQRNQLKSLKQNQRTPKGIQRISIKTKGHQQVINNINKDMSKRWIHT